MYLENVPPRWLIKILERYVNNLNEYNENEIHRHFWFQCIFFIFFNEIKSNELKFNVSKKKSRIRFVNVKFISQI